MACAMNTLMHRCWGAGIDSGRRLRCQHQFWGRPTPNDSDHHGCPGGQYIARKTDVYYLENADTPLFMRPSYKSVNMKVVSQ